MAGSSRVVVAWEKEGEHWDRNGKSKPWKLCLPVGSSAAWVGACLQALALLCGWSMSLQASCQELELG